MFEAVRQKSAYRSVRYSTIRKGAHIAQDSQRKFSRASNKPLPSPQTTLYQTRTISFKPQTAIKYYNHNSDRQDYLQSFHSMMQSQKRVKDQDGSFKAYDLKMKFGNFDDDFLKEDGTQFTLLDPFHRPHTYLINELRKQEKELGSQRDEMKLIKAELNTIKRNVILSLKNTEEQGLKGIQKIRQLIRKNEIQSQQIRMQVRREVTELYQKHDANIHLGQQLTNRSKGMQREIFSCEPFELQTEANFDY